MSNLPPILEGGGNSCRNNKRYACNYGNIKHGKCPGYVVGSRNMVAQGRGRGKYMMHWIDNTPSHSAGRGQNYLHGARFDTVDPSNLEAWNKTRCLPRNANGDITNQNILARNPPHANAEGNEFCELYSPAPREQKGCVNKIGRVYRRFKYPLHQPATPPYVPRQKHGPRAGIVAQPPVAPPRSPSPPHSPPHSPPPFFNLDDDWLDRNEVNRNEVNRLADSAEDLANLVDAIAENPPQPKQMEEVAAENWPVKTMDVDPFQSVYIYSNDDNFEVKESTINPFMLGLFTKRKWKFDRNDANITPLPYTGKHVREQDGQYIIATHEGKHIDGNPDVANILEAEPVVISMASFANEPDKNTAANAEFRDWQIRDGVWIPALYPLRDIERNEEIFVCYGSNYDRDYETSCNQQSQSQSSRRGGGGGKLKKTHSDVIRRMAKNLGLNL